MTRRRRTFSERVIAAFERQWRLLTDSKARRRSEGSKRAWATRKRRALAPQPVPTASTAPDYACRCGTSATCPLHASTIINEVTTVNGGTP